MEIIIHSHYKDKALLYNHYTKTKQQPTDYAPHFHSGYELIFFQSGDISYTINGLKYKLQQNMLVISRPVDRHCIVLDSLQDYERYNIHFDENLLPYNISNIIPHNVNVVDFSSNQTVIDLFKKMDYYYHHLDEKDLKRILINLIDEVLTNIKIESCSGLENNNIPSSLSVQKVNELVDKAVTYIDINLLTIKNLDELCNELYITKSHLHHLFIKHLQITPKKYITTKKLLLARQKILGGATPSEACQICGFSDYSSFFRSYKKYFNYSPTDTQNAKS